MDSTQIDLSVSAEIKLYYDLHLPENSKTPSPLIIAVHGYGAHKRYMMREAKRIAPENFAIVSLQAPNQHFQPKDDGFRVGFGWLTDYKSEESVALHHKFVLDVIKSLVDKGLVDETKIFLYGFSQACALNFRFALTHPQIMQGVLGVCGGIPGDLDKNDLYQPTNADVFYLYSRNDEFYSIEKFEQYDAKLTNYLPNYESKSYEAKHEITDEMRQDMKAWLSVRSA